MVRTGPPGSQLSAIAWRPWPALGYCQADAARRDVGRRIVTSAARDIPQAMRWLGGWTALPR